MDRRSRSRTTYGKPFRTKRGRYGRYKYVNGRRVAFVIVKRMKPFTNRTSKYAGYSRSRTK